MATGPEDRLEMAFAGHAGGVEGAAASHPPHRTGTAGESTVYNRSCLTHFGNAPEARRMVVITSMTGIDMTVRRDCTAQIQPQGGITTHRREYGWGEI